MGYTPIRISTIKPFETITFDLYIHFKDRYLKYIDSGRDLNEEHLTKLKRQQIARFYITDEDEVHYQQFLDSMINNIVNDPTTNTSEKLNFIEGSSTTALEKMQKDPSSASSYSMTQRAAKSLRQIVSQNPDALKEFYGRKAAKNDILIKHCLNVCAMATQLAEMHDIKEEELDELATASLLHDIGMSKLSEEDQSLFHKNSKDFSPGEAMTYRTHPTLCVQILEKNPMINRNITDLILGHEEKISGSGYPNKKSKLSLLEEILSLTNCYDKKITVYNIAPKEALREIRVEELGNYNLSLINKFRELLKKGGLSE